MYIAGGLAILLLALGLAYWGESSRFSSLQLKYDKMNAEKIVSDTQVIRLEGIIKDTNSKLDDLANKEKEHQDIINTKTKQIEIVYKDRYKLVRDLNESEECSALKRIIDEEFNSTISN